MAASVNPAADNNNGGQEGTNNATTNGVNGVSVPANSVIDPTKAALKNSAYLSVDWTPEEHSLLKEFLVEYAADNKLHCYAKIAMQLKNKCVRDIVLRCRWMNKKENGKRRKEDHISRKNKDKKEKVTESMPKSTHVANHTNGPPYAQAVLSMDSDDGISYQAIGGPTGQLLEQNAQALDQIFANFAASKIQENINLFFQARNNILTILNESELLLLLCLCLGSVLSRVSLGNNRSTYKGRGKVCVHSTLPRSHVVGFHWLE